MNLQELKKLGIRELSVSNGQAVAVNPYRKIRGYFRLFFLGNFCPECNSDAPEKDNCPICNNMDYWDVKKSKPLLWDRFKNRKQLIDEKNHQDLMKVLRDRQPVKPPSRFA